MQALLLRPSTEFIPHIALAGAVGKVIGRVARARKAAQEEAHARHLRVVAWGLGYDKAGNSDAQREVPMQTMGYLTSNNYGEEDVRGLWREAWVRHAHWTKDRVYSRARQLCLEVLAKKRVVKNHSQNRTFSAIIASPLGATGMRTRGSFFNRHHHSSTKSRVQHGEPFCTVVARHIARAELYNILVLMRFSLTKLLLYTPINQLGPKECPPIPNCSFVQASVTISAAVR